MSPHGLSTPYREPGHTRARTRRHGGRHVTTCRDRRRRRVDLRGGAGLREFQGLKRTLRRFIFPATIGFLAWYLLYVLMSAFARDFMGQKLFGNINVAYVFGLLQFVSTFVIAFIYSRYAEKHFDPTADRIRHRLEGTTQ
jgi:uncharacterized membrane protein (DUF485 family)